MGNALDEIGQDWFRWTESFREFVSLIDQDDRLLYVNHPQPGIEDYIGRSVYGFVEVDYHDVLRDAVAALRSTGMPQRFESRAAGADGEVSHYINWVVAPNTAVDGLVIFIATDVTQQVLVEAQLEHSESALRSLVENSPDTILILDRNRRILFVNRLRYGLDLDTVMGAPVESFVPEEDRQKVVEGFDAVLSTGEITSYDSGLDSPAGHRRFTTRLAPIPGENGVERVMLVATDITTQVEAERQRQELADQLQQAQKMESLGQLTGGVAHDFNNILVAISGNLELAQMTAAEPRGRDRWIAEAQDAVRRAAKLTERLLAFSRKQTLRPQTIDVAELLDGMSDLLERILGETIRVVVDSGRLHPCRVDPGQLETAVLNLAVNARDAMPDGGDLFIRGSNLSILEDDGAVPPGEYVLLEVTDTGTGMPAEVAARIFEPFFTTKAGHGSGLGLSMVYGFVRQSGGHIRVATEPGEGTTVRIYFQRSASDEITPVKPPAASEPVRGDQQLILVVEDDERVRSLTATVLNHLGYRTSLAEHADAALEHLATDDDIALMVTDVVLSGGRDGFALADEARSLRPGLPVLFVSGYPQDALAERSDDDLSDLLLTKPYTTEQLADAINRHLSG